MQPATSSRLAPQVEIHTLGPGTAALPAIAEVRLRVHAGPPARGTCRGHHFVSTRGEIDVFPAAMEDTWHQADESRSLLLLISPTLLARAAEDLGRDPARIDLEFRHQVRDAQIEHIAWALDAERSAGHPSGALYAESLGLALAARLLGQAAAPARPRARGLTPLQLRRITAYIEEHLEHDLSLATLAEVAGLGPSHLKVQFRRSLGLPVHAYVIERRVERARSLLLGGELPASRIALEAGFAHQSHMARCMRRVLGVTPSELARSARSWSAHG